MLSGGDDGDGELSGCDGDDDGERQVVRQVAKRRDWMGIVAC